MSPDRELGILSGGLLHGAVYFVEDLQTRRAAYDWTRHGVTPYIDSGAVDEQGRHIWTAPPDTPPEILEPTMEIPGTPAAPAWSPDLPAVTCGRCGEPVYRIRNGKNDLTVDADMVPGGMYRFDSRGHPVRRPLAALYADHKAGDEPAGYPLHECAPARDTVTERIAP